MTKKSNLILLVMLVGSLVLPAFVLAQSGQTPEPTATPATQHKPETQATLEKVKLITAVGLDSFVKDLNDNGKLSYRLEKSLGFGGEGETQSYAGVLRLDTEGAGNKYEYDWFTSPDKRRLESRLNYEAKKGFNLVSAFALTACSGGLSEDEANPTSPESLILRLHKGDAFLVERKNGSTEQSREYRVVISKVHLGDSAQKTIQAAIDTAPPGSRPVKILFARQGLLDFSVSVVIESNLSAGNTPKIECRFLKKTSGLPNEVNALAAQGFRFITGRRVGLIGMVLMEKQGAEATVYTFVDEKKYEKEFDKTIGLGNTYQAIMAGDLTCDSTEVENERLVFAQNSGSVKREYKIHSIGIDKGGNPTAASLLEFQRLVGENYQIKDLFYSRGLNVILEK